MHSANDGRGCTPLELRIEPHGLSQDSGLGGSLGKTIRTEIAAAMTSPDSTQANQSLA